MPLQIKLLTGAPKANQIDWARSATLDELQPAFKRFLGSERPGLDNIQDPHPASTQRSLIKWRQIHPAHIEPIFTRDSEVEHPAHNKNRPCAAENGSDLFTPTRANHAEFIEHSFLTLDAINSSQICGPDNHDPSTQDQDTTFLSASLLSTNSLDSSIPSLALSQLRSQNPHPLRVSISAKTVTPLSRLPKATYLLSIRPQTMTTTVLVGVISISQSRTVSLRRGGEKDIIELLVGDDTATGFSITIWLPPQPCTPDHPHSHAARPLAFHRAEIQTLRPGDVVLIQMLALSTFRGKVFGQSLARVSSGTRFVVLKSMRTGDVAGSLTGPAAGVVREKMERVVSWVERFVGLGAGATKKRKRDLGEFLPPDSPA